MDLSGTPTQTFSVKGVDLECHEPFTSEVVQKLQGEELENVANTLNQTWKENLRNNFAKAVEDAKKEAKENGRDLDVGALQKELSEYEASYFFGKGGGGGFRPADPIEAEAMRLARDAVEKALKDKGYKTKDISRRMVTDLAKKTLEGPNGPAFQKRAQANVKAQQELDRSVEAAVADEIGA